jgi:hypothetical protein
MREARTSYPGIGRASMGGRRVQSRGGTVAYGVQTPSWQANEIAPKPSMRDWGAIVGISFPGIDCQDAVLLGD